MFSLPHHYAAFRFAVMLPRNLTKGSKMLKAAVMGAMLSVCATPVIASPYTISADYGGLLSEYLDKYKSWSKQGAEVQVLGTCLSACTFVLFEKFNLNVCAGPYARFGFHGVAYGPTVQDRDMLYAMQVEKLVIASYPKHVQDLIADMPRPLNGDKQSDMKYVNPLKLVPKCQ